MRRTRPRTTFDLGFEFVAPGALGTKPRSQISDHPNPGAPAFLGRGARHAQHSPDLKRGPPMQRIFGVTPAEYFGEYWGGMEYLAKICLKCVPFLYLQFRAGYDEAAVFAPLPPPLRSQTGFPSTCAPKPPCFAYNISLTPGYDFLIISAQDGATCSIVENEAFVHVNKRDNQAIDLFAVGFATDYPQTVGDAVRWIRFVMG